MQNPLKTLTKFEWLLWIASVLTVAISFLIVPKRDFLTLTSSIIGVTALIFVAKGHVIGQLLCIIFAVFYGIISFYFKYYGEMITYLGMSAPTALAALISWIRHPFRQSAEVEVKETTKKDLALLFSLATAVTIAFFFILKALGTANLAVSTLSVTTSFLASFLTVLRSPYYALAYAANDVALIVLWILAALSDISTLPMVACFVAFLANDFYGYINWSRMKKRQKNA